MTAGKRGPWTSQLEEARADWQKAHTPATLVSGDKAGWRGQGLLSPSVKGYLKIPKTMLEAWFTSPVRMVLKANSSISSSKWQTNYDLDSKSSNQKPSISFGNKWQRF